MIIDMPYKPFHSVPNAHLFCGDSLEIMAELPAESVDLIFADPPYGMSNDGMSLHAGKRVSVNKGEWDRSRGAARDFEFHSAWIKACRRLLKPNGALWLSGTYHSIYLCGYALQTDGWHILNEISWYKPNAAPHLACRMFAASHETLIWARKSKDAKHYFDYELMRNGEWNGDFIKRPNRQMRSVWAINTPAPAEKRFGKHPTQKPVALMNRIVLSSSREGDLVLDPFCGSATTGVAALSCNRKFIGIDSEKSYLTKLAMPRLDKLTGDIKTIGLEELQARAKAAAQKERFEGSAQTSLEVYA